ncbi:DUF4974 domain-containing protein [Puteibacter caeruleilacunae]|nr:DUF4974 domain-containing protein [Puteibacter caeruleilacunae]
MNLNEEHIIDLVDAYISEKLTKDQRDEITRIFAVNSEDKQLFQKYYRLYKSVKSYDFIEKNNAEEAWSKIRSNISTPKTIKLAPWLPYVAVAVIVIGIFLLPNLFYKSNTSTPTTFEQLIDVERGKAILTMADGSIVNLDKNKKVELSEQDGTKISKDSTNSISYQMQKKQLSQTAAKTKVIYNTVFVPKGGEFKLTLSDGTKVILNADSELKFPVKFDSKKREVYLTGEAYFDVTHIKDIPFSVKTFDTEITVLGTEFNVSAYKNQSFIATTLVEGSVQVKKHDNYKKLDPGFQSMIQRDSNTIEIREVDTYLYTSWTKGVFEFENAELESIMIQLTRWYNVDFSFEKEAYKRIRFTGAIKKDRSFEYALTMIERVANIKFSIKDKFVLVGKE